MIASVTSKEMPYLLQEIVDIKVHLENGSLSAFVMQDNDECARRWGGDIEIDIRPTDGCNETTERL